MYLRYLLHKSVVEGSNVVVFTFNQAFVVLCMSALECLC